MEKLLLGIQAHLQDCSKIPLDTISTRASIQLVLQALL